MKKTNSVQNEEDEIPGKTHNLLLTSPTESKQTEADERITPGHPKGKKPKAMLPKTRARGHWYPGHGPRHVPKSS